ncbi:MAG: endo-1,4-beta-xylanase [Methylobacteriaceae bacterium]|nr:endo-1,4-beta-xylanase [Methylobacteriaceae bacterium]
MSVFDFARPTRRSFLCGAAALAAAPGAMATELAPIGAAAQEAGLLFGASIAREALEDHAYAALYRRHARIVTTDWALKFDALRPRREAWQFTEADRLIDFAAQSGIAARGHALIWNEATPDWLKSLSARETARVFDEHVDRVVGRYAGRLHSWDVVNEPFWPDHRKPGGWRDGPWLAALGPDYVARALKRASKADPKARLTINEAHCEIVGGWGDGIRPRLMALVDRLKQADVPLHAVGLQAHLKPQWGHDDDAFLAFMEGLGRLGVDVYLTELDVDDEAYPAEPAARDAQVAARYAAFLRAALRCRALKMVVLWQLSDKYSWLRAPDVKRARKVAFEARPLPFDERLAAKPAAKALLDAFRARVATR